jgi:chemotaxis protein methyltransferase CheR
MTDAARLDELKRLLVQTTGLRIPSTADNRFVAMLTERAARKHYATLDEYSTFLEEHPAAEEWEAIARVFSSGETFFFRDHGQFDLLRLRLLPELIARHRKDKTLRLWSAGCASGEEAYSLAMLVDMLLPEHDDWNIAIFGSDIDSLAVTKAQSGHYGDWSFRMVPATLKQRYFQQRNNEWILDERIRRMVRFRISNLITDTYTALGSELRDMDLILCRNVFIYFDPSAVSAVARKLTGALVEGGYLLTAHTELIGHPLPELTSRLFAEGMVHQRHNIYTADTPVSTAAAIAAAPIGAPTPPPLVTGDQSRPEAVHRLLEIEPPSTATLYALAREHADRGEYQLADQICREALTADPFFGAAYFLLAQLAQLKGDSVRAKECLNKAIYLDHHCVAAYLELAALYERSADIPRAQCLRHAALDILRGMPAEQAIEQYETTAGELAQWLAQWQANANNHGNTDGNHDRSPLHGS